MSELRYRYFSGTCLELVGGLLDIAFPAEEEQVPEEFRSLLEAADGRPDEDALKAA